MGLNTAELSDEQLVHKMLQLERDLVRDQFKLALNQLENTANIRDIRRDRARLLTEARKRELAQDLQKNTLLHTHKKTFVADGGEAVEESGSEAGGFLSGIVDKLSGND